MFDPMKDIRDFHEKFGLAYEGKPRFLPKDLARLREDRLLEEASEYEDAQEMHSQLDALVDVVYIALGTAYLQGFDFEEAWRRVHAANMAKVRAATEKDSRHGSTFDIVKPFGWTAPDLKDLCE